MRRIKNIFLLFLLIYAGQFTFAQTELNYDKKNTALLIIDIQYFYFTGGSLPLVKPEKATEKASKILHRFRSEGMLVVHIKHNAKANAEIYPDVIPVKGEKVILKNEANAFLKTDLLDFLRKNGIKNLVITGMQTQMCVEATTRAAHDFGFHCTVVRDACATRDLKYDGYTVKAHDVQYAVLSTMNGYYARVLKTADLLKELNQ